jgi:Transposase DDE domain
LHAALVAQPCSCIRRLAGKRSREIKFTRFLRNHNVTAGEMATHAAERTAAQAAGRDVVVIQDTSELALGGRRAKANGYGPVGKGGGLRGLLLHAVLAVDAETGGVIGLVDADVRNREGGKVRSRRTRKTREKESQRWIDGTTRASEVLVAAKSITGVSDRESDIYEHFASRPSNMHLIVRACQNRLIEMGSGDPPGLLFCFADGLRPHGRFKAQIPAAPGRKARVAELEVRFSRVALCKPRHANGHGLPASISLSMVDVRETSKPEDGSELIHWRLLTTHEVKILYQARRIIELYRLRWIIEEYFHTLKTAGFDIEVADIGAPQVMIKFVTAVAVAAVTVMQLVKARDGTTGQKLAVVFDPADQPILEAVSAQLEGKTVLQQNPHPKGSLAFAAWVMGRLGGWTAYYGKPGPKVMRRGFEAFQRIKFGAMLGLQNV